MEQNLLPPLRGLFQERFYPPRLTFHGPPPFAAPQFRQIKNFQISGLEFQRACIILRTSMRQWPAFWLCLVAGAICFVCGWLMPVHLRAVDPGVLAKAGRNTPSLEQTGLALVRDRNLASAQLLAQAAAVEAAPGRENLSSVVESQARDHPGWLEWSGNDPRLELTFTADHERTNAGPEPVTEFMIRRVNREWALGLLAISSQPA